MLHQLQNHFGTTIRTMILVNAILVATPWGPSAGAEAVTADPLPCWLVAVTPLEVSPVVRFQAGHAPCPPGPPGGASSKHLFARQAWRPPGVAAAAADVAVVAFVDEGDVASTLIVTARSVSGPLWTQPYPFAGRADSPAVGVTSDEAIVAFRHWRDSRASIVALSVSRTDVGELPAVISELSETTAGEPVSWRSAPEIAVDPETNRVIVVWVEHRRIERGERVLVVASVRGTSEPVRWSGPIEVTIGTQSETELADCGRPETAVAVSVDTAGCARVASILLECDGNDSDESFGIDLVTLNRID